jgi:hypothetical protein
MGKSMIDLQNNGDEVTSLSAGDLFLVTTDPAGTADDKVISLESLQALMDWIPDDNTWTYSSADDPTFVISVNADMTSRVGVGNRIQLVQSSTTKYFIVTAVGSYSGGATLITVYGGTDYDLANATISSPKYSRVKAPFGFPLDPDKWTVTMTDTSNRSQASPTQNVWYNVGSLSISIPIGLWRVYYEATPEIVATPGAATNYGFKVTLSTANNSESEALMTARKTSALPAMTGAVDRFSVHKEKIYSLASKTTHYLNVLTGTAGATSISIRGDDATTLVRAVSAYL